MDGATKFAVAILLLFLAMVAFFFAFHPHGVENVTNPDTALQWLMGQFDTASGNAPAGDSGGAGGTTGGGAGHATTA